MAIINGIVLYTRPYRDNDLLVRMLTEERGLYTFLARGAKRPKSNLAAGTQPFSRLSFIGNWSKKPQGLGFMNDIQSQQSASALTADIEVSAYAALIAKLLDQSFEEGQPVPAWYQQFNLALDKLAQGVDPQVIANIFEIQLLGPLGVAPNWRADPIDGHMEGQFDYSEKYNGILGAEHYGLDENRLNLDQKTVYYLRLFSTISLEQLGKVKLSPATKRGLQRVIDYIYEKQVGLVPKEKTFINKMHAWQQSAGQLLEKGRSS
ncbi:DNA repair protein RecO [Leuconostocaceae bacterium ESL0723]|nr:DNA repair protein RecO [Leuconostocaceae bacterium ESL0723]